MKRKPKPRKLESFFQFKGFDEKGFYWYHKYKSEDETPHLMKEPKEHGLAIPLCMLRFIWFDRVEKIVSIGGSLERITHEEMEDVFKSRTENSPTAHWRAADSKPIEDDELELKLKQISKIVDPTGDLHETRARSAEWEAWKFVPMGGMEFWGHEKVEYVFDKEKE